MPTEIQHMIACQRCKKEFVPDEFPGLPKHDCRPTVQPIPWGHGLNDWVIENGEISLQTPNSYEIDGERGDKRPNPDGSSRGLAEL